MAQNTNYIIGHGEALSSDITLNSGGGDKTYPYTYDESVARLSEPIAKALDKVDRLPELACPEDQAVVAITLHPSFLAKSYRPEKLLSGLGLRQVGSRERKDLTPAKYVGKQSDPLTSELFIAGRRDQLRQLLPENGVISGSPAMRDDFVKIESVRALGDDRLKRQHFSNGIMPIEVVIHSKIDPTLEDGGNFVVNGFREWVSSISERLTIEELRHVGGLTFVNMYATSDSLEKLMDFSFVRAARRMPQLAYREVGSKSDMLQDQIGIDELPRSVMDIGARIAVFDGGLPMDHPFGALVDYREPTKIGAPDATALEHGVQVTSAALFGPILESAQIDQPFATVDHWRVIDDIADDFELTAVLDRITNVLRSENYNVANLSLGPDAAMVDDDVHIWTAAMDQIAALGDTIIVSAAGNNGGDSAGIGFDRVQPSADGVNVLGVGARDCLDLDWGRAEYSAKGPGRSPGLIKPDCLAVGGDEFTPFYTVTEPGVAVGTYGTSYSSPTVARIAIGICSQFPRLTPTAARCLLIHTCDPGKHSQSEVGWGSVQHKLTDIVECAADSATVVYQGRLSQRRHMRYEIPCPTGGFSNLVEITATFVVATPVDPEDAVSYSQVAASIIFRPDTTGDPGLTESGKPKAHPSKDFFSKATMFQTEQELRADSHRWEPVKKASKRFRPGTLQSPVFDVEHLMRQNGGNAARNDDVPYALVVTIKESGNSNLYKDILDAYPILRALQPAIDLDIDT